MVKEALEDALADALDDACREGPDAVVETLGQLALAALVGSLPRDEDANVRAARERLAQIVRMMSARDLLRGLV